MNLRMSSPYNPPRDSYYGAMNPAQWDLEGTPDWVLHGDDVLQEESKQVQGTNSALNFFRDFVSAFGPIGRIFSAFMEIPAHQLNSRQVELNNYRKQFEARRADWYNSPIQQLKRLRKAGLNPFMQNYVKSYPSNIPEPDSYIQQVPHFQPESTAGLMNALTNYRLAGPRVRNLDSLSALNEYKGEFLYPQLYEANGYANAIAGLQVAWENNNYDYERLLKQEILEVQYENSLIETGKGLMESMAQIPGSYIKLDPVAGTLLVQVPNEDGSMSNYELSELPFDKLPPFLQEKLTNIWSTRQLTNSKTQLNTIIGNTQSALGGLYNANKQKVDIYCTEYEKTGLWPDSDAYLRAAAGSIPWSYINQAQANQLGWGAANAAVGLGVDASKILLNHGIGSYFGMKKGAFLQGVKDAGGYRLPKGAKPYINADWNSYNSPYNYNFIY